MSIDWRSRKTWAVFIAAFALMFILGMCDVPKATSTAPVVEQKVRLTASYPIECSSAEPCSGWTQRHARLAYRDGRIGPKSVKVPASVRRAIRRKVHDRGPKFEKRVMDNMPFYQRANWYVNCFGTMGYNAAFKGNDGMLMKCATPSQIKSRFERINKVYVDCSGKTLVAGGVGSMVKPRANNAVIGAVGGGVGCMAEAGLDAAYDESKPFRDALAAGFRSLLVTAAKRYY